jgi:hypothetical protein
MMHCLRSSPTRPNRSDMSSRSVLAAFARSVPSSLQASGQELTGTPASSTGPSAGVEE